MMTNEIPFTRCVMAVVLGAILFPAVPMSHAGPLVTAAWWRIGENDPGAVHGAGTVATTNLQGGVFEVDGSPAYTTNTASGSGSGMALEFSGWQYCVSAIPTTATENFGIELWVKPAETNGTRCLAYNGLPSLECGSHGSRGGQGAVSGRGVVRALCSWED